MPQRTLSASSQAAAARSAKELLNKRLLFLVSFSGVPSFTIPYDWLTFARCSESMDRDRLYAHQYGRIGGERAALV